MSTTKWTVSMWVVLVVVMGVYYFLCPVRETNQRKAVDKCKIIINEIMDR